MGRDEREPVRLAQEEGKVGRTRTRSFWVTGGREGGREGRQVRGEVEEQSSKWRRGREAGKAYRM